MTLKFEKIPGKEQSPIWNVISNDTFMGRIEPLNGGELAFSIARIEYGIVDSALAEIAAFIRQQSEEAAPAAADTALEKRVAELEKLVAPMIERQKKHKPPTPRKEISLLCSMADEMANCTNYMVRDRDGGLAGRDPKIDRALAKVREFFKLK